MADAAAAGSAGFVRQPQLRGSQTPPGGLGERLRCVDGRQSLAGAAMSAACRHAQGDAVAACAKGHIAPEILAGARGSSRRFPKDVYLKGVIDK